MKRCAVVVVALLLCVACGPASPSVRDSTATEGVIEETQGLLSEESAATGVLGETISTTPIATRIAEPSSTSPSETPPAKSDALAWDSEFLAQIGGTTSEVAIHGDLALLTKGPRLLTLDVSEPTVPLLLGKTSTMPEWPLGVSVIGSYAYVAAGKDGGLRVVDISDPLSPVEIGFYDTPDFANGVVATADYVYVADGYSGLRVVDVSTPSEPIEVGFFDTPGVALRVAVTKEYAYVADSTAGLRVIDIRNPSSPIEVASYEIGYGRDIGVYAYDIALAESYAYMAENSLSADESSVMFPRESGLGNKPVPKYGTIVSEGNDDEKKKDVQPRVQT
jgi:hypothetical protein